jgi:HEAT repeat protein
MQHDDLAEQSTEQLVAFALACDSEDHARWDAIYVLQKRATREVFDEAQRLCTSPELQRRCLGVDILAQGQIPSKTRTFHEEAVALLLQLLEREDQPRVLESIAYALGHRHDARSIRLLLGLRHHPNADVRFAVVNGLLAHEDERAVQALIELSADEDSDVRDWATFGLGTQIELTTPALLDALAARLSDPDDDTRAEAIVGLARRHDKRVVPVRVAEIEGGWDTDMTDDAVEAFPDPDVLAAVARANARRDDEARA